MFTMGRVSEETKGIGPGDERDGAGPVLTRFSFDRGVRGYVPRTSHENPDRSSP